MYSQDEAGPTFGHANAILSLFIDHIRNQFQKKTNNDNDLNWHSMTKLSSWLGYCIIQYRERKIDELIEPNKPIDKEHSRYLDIVVQR